MRDSRLRFDRHYLNRAGELIDIEECERLFRDHAYRVVAHDYVGETLVSTVWLGVGQMPAIGPRDTPAVFETMVFSGDDDSSDNPQWRYATEDEARAGHATVVRRVLDAQREPNGTREELIVPDDSRPIAELEPGSVDISGLDKAELLAALVNGASITTPFVQPRLLTHEQAAAIIQERLGAGHGEHGRPVFDFDYCAGRPIKVDIRGPRISAFHVARYDRDAGEGTLARVVGKLREAFDRRRAEREALS